jgi:hypothetical protein
VAVLLHDGRPARTPVCAARLAGSRSVRRRSQGRESVRQLGCAIEIETGKYRWHFQTIHHDLWDADPPAPPGLFDITRNGRTIPALALTTMSGYVSILNRETGQPVFGVEERAMPKSEVPGELAFPTQPFPAKPPPIARNQFKPQDLVTADDTTAEHAAACKDLVEKNGTYKAGAVHAVGVSARGRRRAENRACVPRWTRRRQLGRHGVRFAVPSWSRPTL